MSLASIYFHCLSNNNYHCLLIPNSSSRVDIQFVTYQLDNWTACQKICVSFCSLTSVFINSIGMVSFRSDYDPLVSDYFIAWLGSVGRCLDKGELYM